MIGGYGTVPQVDPAYTTGGGFLTAFALDGKSLVYSTRIPAGPDFMVMDPYGNLVMVGRSGLLTKVSTFPISIRFSTVVGGSASCCETVHGVATDAMGDIYGIPPVLRTICLSAMG